MRYSTPEALELLHEGSLALSAMEANGVRVNVDYLNSTTKETQQRIGELEEVMMRDKEIIPTWKKRFKDKMKLGSRDQLAVVLFEEMGYTPVEVTESKQRGKVNKELVDEIDLPLIRQFVEVEELKKVLSTYLTGIQREMVEHDGYFYVHPNYNLHIASTYRSTCDHPNFQNAPKRNPDLAKLVRPCYVPHPGHHLVEIDFGQLEVRVSACYHKDPVMIRYINDPTTDMHRDAAMPMFFLNLDQIKEMKKNARDTAKNAFVFAQFYGSVYFNCAKNIWKRMKRDVKRGDWIVPGTGGKNIFQHLEDNGIKSCGACVMGQEPIKGTFEFHMRKVEEQFWARFKKYTAWKKSFVEQYRREGGFSMLTGFRVNGLHSRNDVICYPVQGSAFHCLLWCIIRINKWLKRYKMRSKLVGQIHDSLVASVHPAELQDFLTVCHQVMTEDMPKHYDWIIVPMETESEVTQVNENWYTAKQWVETDGLWALKA